MFLVKSGKGSQLNQLVAKNKLHRKTQAKIKVHHSQTDMRTVIPRLSLGFEI